MNFVELNETIVYFRLSLVKFENNVYSYLYGK